MFSTLTLENYSIYITWCITLQTFILRRPFNRTAYTVTNTTNRQLVSISEVICRSMYVYESRLKSCFREPQNLRIDRFQADTRKHFCFMFKAFPLPIWTKCHVHTEQVLSSHTTGSGNCTNTATETGQGSGDPHKGWKFINGTWVWLSIDFRSKTITENTSECEATQLVGTLRLQLPRLRLKLGSCAVSVRTSIHWHYSQLWASAISVCTDIHRHYSPLSASATSVY